jgi:hypothetical protein
MRVTAPHPDRGERTGNRLDRSADQRVGEEIDDCLDGVDHLVLDEHGHGDDEERERETGSDQLNGASGSRRGRRDPRAAGAVRRCR